MENKLAGSSRNLDKWKIKQDIFWVLSLCDWNSEELKGSYFIWDFLPKGLAKFVWSPTKQRVYATKAGNNNFWLQYSEL